jgi:hypothetical protein
MAKYLVEGGYECDRQSKYDFTASTVSYLIENFNPKSIIFKEFDENGNEVDFDSPLSSTVSHTDLVMYYNGHPYLIELKERWGKYISTYYGKDGDDEGWFLNIPKKEELTNQQWATPLYVNLYPDGIVRLWNLRKIDHYNTLNKVIDNSTVEDKGKKEQNRYDVWNRDSIAINRIKGQPSNGIFTATSTSQF